MLEVVVWSALSALVTVGVIAGLWLLVQRHIARRHARSTLELWAKMYGVEPIKGESLEELRTRILSVHMGMGGRRK